MSTELDQFKRRTVAELSHRLERGDLERPEYDRRVAMARRADSPGALKSLLVDLEREPGPTRVQRATAPVPVRSSGEESEFVLAIMSGTTRSGHWEPPESIQCLAIMGGVDLDLRDAALLDGLTDVTAIAIMGGVRVIVPPDVHVTVSGFGLLGGFGRVDNRAMDPGAPHVRVGGLALMGGVDVKVAAPGEAIDEND